MEKKLITASMVLVLLVPFLFVGCSFIAGEIVTTSPTVMRQEGFAIYLTKNNISLQDMKKLSQIEITDEPVIGANDILAYCWDTHEMLISPAAYERIKESPEDTPLLVFAACVDNQPVYWGAFWSAVSSSMPYCVNIDRPLFVNGDHGYVIRINEGYNANIIYGGDPRDNLVIYNALEKAGKLTGPLVTYIPTTTTTPITEGFALYLTKDNVPPTENMAYNWPDWELTPVVSQKDIISYNYDTHEMALAPEAYQRLMDMDIPVVGRSFLFMIDRNPVWWGAFWTPVSSISYDGYVICVPPLDDLPENTVRIDYGYPVLGTPPKSDIRDHIRILELLQNEGKLAEPLVLFAFPPSAPVKPEGVAVYLTAGDVSVFEIHVYRTIALQAEPLIGSEDIISYDLATHQMTLSQEAFMRLNAFDKPLNGLSFVLCVDGAPVYWGALWNGDFRMSFHGPVMGAFPYIEKENTVAISFGVTGNISPRGEDPRSNPLIRDALEKDRKLK